jgi:hypothetical protein
VGPRAGLDTVEKRKMFTLAGLELRPLVRPARSQSLYRLRYPSSGSYIGRKKNTGGITFQHALVLSTLYQWISLYVYIFRQWVMNSYLGRS